MGNYMKDYDGLSQDDKNNINFLLNASPETMEDWMNMVDEDDLDYACHLLNMAKLRMIDIVAKNDMSEAQKALSKYTLT
jgi:DNA-binding MurR/RpiR family transcriptional regulator